MLTFFATLLVNILVGTVFYLIISLKLEKSASELHVKKIRREMDDMIREFNLTAERNISLLENRIDIMKRLLEKNGIPVEFDVRSEDRDATRMSFGDFAASSAAEGTQDDPVDEKKGFLGKIGGQLRDAIGEARTIRENTETVKKDAKGRKMKNASRHDGSSESEERKSPRNSSIIRSDEILRNKFAAAPDRAKKYELINELFAEGFSAEEISRLSGVPSGEITLIASLNRGN
ncbi:MAG TPA: hypothetical protein PKK43_03110 [Spirochaetota bacterium]|nr:hypothetical protein [Spirochaetota bacterium]